MASAVWPPRWKRKSMTSTGSTDKKNRRAKVAIIGSGNIGTDLMIKIMRTSATLEMGALVGIDEKSDGLARARRLGVATTSEGIEGLRGLEVYSDIELVFDASSAAAHHAHAHVLLADGKRVVDLTPAAIGPYVVPSVNMDEHLGSQIVNMVTCGARQQSPSWRRWRASRVVYAEIVASIASLLPDRAHGPTSTNSRQQRRARWRWSAAPSAARRSSLPIPRSRRSSCGTPFMDLPRPRIGSAAARHEDTVAEVRRYVPGYRLKQDIQFEPISHNDPLSIPGIDALSAA